MKKSASGFTIVELLIVIVVITILAATSLIAFKGVQKRTAEAVLQSDLRQAKTYMEQQNIDNGSYPSVTTTIPKSEKTSYQLALSYGNVYCLTATIPGSGASPYHVTNADGVQSGPCQGHTYGGPAPAGVNIAPPLEQWTLSGGAMYDAVTKEVTLPSVGSTVASPLIRVDVPKTFTMSIESYSPSAGYRYANSSYYDEDHNPYMLSGGYYGNGDAKAIPAELWFVTTWSLGEVYPGTGPNFMYVQYKISVSSSYGVPGTRIRNPIITLTR